MIIVAIFKTLGKFALSLAVCAFLVGVSLLILGSYLMTWPILRKSPRERKLQTGIELASALFTFLAAVQPETRKDDTVE